MTTPATPAAQHILWSCVARNDVILAEAGEDTWEGAVAATAKQLLAKKPTAGYEFHTQSTASRFRLPKNSSITQPRLKGIKFHIYDHPDGTEEDCGIRIWSFCAVYDPTQIDRVPVQSFLEKIVGITEMQRETDEWKFGGTLSCQRSFAPILLQRMQDVTYLGKMAVLNQQLDSSKQLMQENITRILEREEKLESLQEETTRLQDMASVFKKRSKKLRRIKMMQNAKHGLVVGTAITAGVAVVVVPPLVALL